MFKQTSIVLFGILIGSLLFVFYLLYLRPSISQVHHITTSAQSITLSQPSISVTKTSIAETKQTPILSTPTNPPLPPQSSSQTQSPPAKIPPLVDAQQQQTPQHLRKLNITSKPIDPNSKIIRLMNKDKRAGCSRLESKFSVVPGSSWGTITPQFQQ